MNKQLSPSNTEPTPSEPELALDLRALATTLIKHYGLHEGRFQVAVKFRIGAGAVASGTGNDKAVPGVVVGVEGVALNPAKEDTKSEDIVDASEVNPA